MIKGASSTLYGGGAIAGLVNLISKTPTQERDNYAPLDGYVVNGGDQDPDLIRDSVVNSRTRVHSLHERGYEQAKFYITGPA